MSGTVSAKSLIGALEKKGAIYSIAPLQDLLNLGAEARMNLPGYVEANWGWRSREECCARRFSSDFGI